MLEEYHGTCNIVDDSEIERAASLDIEGNKKGSHSSKSHFDAIVTCRSSEICPTTKVVLR